MKCRNCGSEMRRLMLLALLQDAGARVYPSVEYCAEGQHHDFSEPPADIARQEAPK